LKIISDYELDTDHTVSKTVSFNEQKSRERERMISLVTLSSSEESSDENETYRNVHMGDYWSRGESRNTSVL